MVAHTFSSIVKENMLLAVLRRNRQRYVFKTVVAPYRNGTANKKRLI